MSKAKRVRRLDFDLLRVASMAAVVYLHTAADGLRQSEDMVLWHLSNLLSSLAVAAVPLFFPKIIITLRGLWENRTRRSNDTGRQ